MQIPGQNPSLNDTPEPREPTCTCTHWAAGAVNDAGELACIIQLRMPGLGVPMIVRTGHSFEQRLSRALSAESR